MRCNVLYLEDVAEEQGILFEKVVEMGYCLEDFIEQYMSSNIRRFIDSGSAFHCTMYYYDILSGLKKENFRFKKARTTQDSWMAKWVGEFYARLQWATNRSSEYVLACVPIKEIVRHYNVLHDIDMQLLLNRYKGRVK